MFESLFKALLPPDVVTFEKDWCDFRMFAIRRHGLQQYGDLPYSFHLAMVETCLLESNFTEYHFQAGAWLHDICEDTKTTLENVVSNYGGAVAGIVWACTGVGKNRKERAASIYKKLSQNPLAAPVKVADRISNVMTACSGAKNGDSSKLAMYISEWDEFKKNVEPLMEDEKRKTHLWATLEEVIDEGKSLLQEAKLKEKNVANESKLPDAA
jgi:(p)ppGpp synthase/HD superfamily hydrolase